MNRSRPHPHAPPDVGAPAFNDLPSLYDTYGRRVYQLALRLCRSRQEAEDLTHDVFLRYWQSKRYEPSRGGVLPYLLMLTRSMALNLIQQKRNRWQLLQRWSHQVFKTSDSDGQERLEINELADRVRQALATLPAKQREVLELAYYEGLSQSAIGERIEVPLGTVKTRSRQGLIRLRAQLFDLKETP